jgi:hypothetical protein
MKILITLSILLSSSIAFCQHLIPGSIRDLHPCQMAVGEKAVEAKRKDYKKLDKKDFDNFLMKNPVPVAKGPKGQYYIIDHHHMTRALYEMGWDQVYLDVQADYSNLNLTDFWKKMDAQKWVYLVDETGKPITAEQIPASVADLKDDYCRSLAYFVREKGGFDKTATPFVEFQWGEFFRSHITKAEWDADWKKAVKKAVDLANSPSACDLPGYQGKRSCSKVLKGQ